MVFKRTPVALRPDFVIHQKLFFALQLTGALPKLHTKIFDAIHKSKEPFETEESILRFVSSQGLDSAQFMQTMNSFAVNNLIAQNNKLQDQYKLHGVPTIGIDGQFMTSLEYTRTFDNLLTVADALTRWVRHNRPAS